MFDLERSQYVRSSLSEGDSFLGRQLARTAQHAWLMVGHLNLKDFRSPGVWHGVVFGHQ